MDNNFFIKMIIQKIINHFFLFTDTTKEKYNHRKTLEKQKAALSLTAISSRHTLYDKT